MTCWERPIRTRSTGKKGRQAGYGVGEASMNDYDCVWFWRKFLGDRKGEACRRVCQGRNGNVLVEFTDGFRVVAPRYAVRSTA